MSHQAKLSLRRYRRPFSRPMRAAWGIWSVREGLVLRTEDQETGMVGFGEAAPLPRKGAALPKSFDSFEASESFFKHPSYEFALWTSEQRIPDAADTPSVRTAALLSLDHEAPTKIEGMRDAGMKAFKLKLGLDTPEKEWEALQEFVIALKEGEKIRLDPNRSWDVQTWKFWKPRLRGISGSIQFIEEPFKEGTSMDAIMREVENSPVPLALDESLFNGGIHKWAERQWPGFWIIKPSVLGPPDRWLPSVERDRERVVLSSVFETGIGLSSLVRLAGAFPGIDHGLGTQAYFEDSLGVRQQGALLTAMTAQQQEELWNNLPVK